METSRIRSDHEGPPIYHPKPDVDKPHRYESTEWMDEPTPFADGLELVGKGLLILAAVGLSPLWAPVYFIGRLAQKISRG